MHTSGGREKQAERVLKFLIETKHCRTASVRSGIRKEGEGTMNLKRALFFRACSTQARVDFIGRNWCILQRVDCVSGGVGWDGVGLDLLIQKGH